MRRSLIQTKAGLRRSQGLGMVFAIAVCASACATASSGAGARPQVLDDRTPEALFQRGVEAQRSGDGTRAEQYYAAALSRGYPAERAFAALLNVCLVSDRYDTALYYARARLREQPQNWSLRYLAATLALAAGQEERAVEELQRLIDERPKRPEPHYLMGVVARDHLRDKKLAVTSFNRYLAMSPTGPHAAEARLFLRRGELRFGKERKSR
ncbi:MAG TPA: tetratricopeptide repeat protein [Polyangia bacterium]